MSSIKKFLSPSANWQSIKNVGSSASRNTTFVKQGMGNAKRRLQNMLSFNIGGPFSNFIKSSIIAYVLYWFIKKAMQRMEYNNVVAFIGHCVDYWMYIVLILIIFSTLLQLI